MKSLRFIHITKTAGTTIEELAKKKNIHWGMYDRGYGKLCPIERPSPWHRFTKYTENIEDTNWFMVVRNPYDRIISEFHCIHSGMYDYARYFSKSEFNHYLTREIQSRYRFGDHYSEQYKYLIKNKDVKLHILKYENLKQEFNSLMKDYNIDLEIDDPPKKLRYFTTQDISENNINLINKIYDKDFKIFNYQKIKKLRFIHITKTGGTSVENFAFSKKIRWGRFDKQYGNYDQDTSPPWHNLPCYTHNLKQYDWFMIVRNPYDRLISEFHCVWGGVGDLVSKYDKDNFNQFLQNSIKKQNEFGDHYTPQYKYLIKDDDVKVTVLKLENLKTEFPKLMSEYGLDIKLGKQLNSNKKKFHVKDLSPETLALINDVYSQDFEEFGYTKIT